MLNLNLREEFRGDHMPGTAIALRTSDNQGAAQKPAEEILSITYPTADVQTSLKAISKKRNGCPVVLIGDRGRGKSHIMAVMHHAIESPDIVEKWLNEWSLKTGNTELQNFVLEKGYFPISEPVHNHEYFHLWDLLFDRHPKGQYYRGQFEHMNQPFPPRTLLEKMFEEQPTCLILDEFQTWYTGLPEEYGDKKIKIKQYAFNFTQILSEIAKEQPHKLIFIISVLNNVNDAFQQVHRQSPVIVDFRGPSAKQDRQKLLLHRLFDNRRNIVDTEIQKISNPYAVERCRLLYNDKNNVEKERLQQEVFDCWPYSPELIELLEDHILLSTAAQETRDMIRILAQVYKSRGNAVPVITSADFFVDGQTDEVQTLVDSISVMAGQEKLRQIAQRNLELVRSTGINVVNDRELISSIWMRSLSPGKTAGGTQAELHLDITRDKAIDDNSFLADIVKLIENSVNIHGDEVQGGRLWFGVEENPRSKIRACAKNNKLWEQGAVSSSGMTVYPGKDISHIRNTLRHMYVPETAQPSSRVIILGPNWENDPWGEVDESDKPEKWTIPVLLVIPDQIDVDQQAVSSVLGKWLAKHVQRRRNTVRFLLVTPGEAGIFSDEELIYSARCSYLCSPEGWGTDSKYRLLKQDFERPLRSTIKSRFNRFAILQKWDYQQPQNCIFDIERITEQGSDIPGAVEARIMRDIFDLNNFSNVILTRAKDSDTVGIVLDDLTEPPPPGSGEIIPYLGETATYELILRIAAGGSIALNVSGTWIARRTEDSNEDDALRYIRSKAFRSGQEMRQVQLGLPGIVGGGTVTAPGAQNTTPQTPSGMVTPGQNNGNTTSTPFTVPTQTGGKVADGKNDSNQNTANKKTQTKKTDEPATAINLSGYFEKWGIPADQSIGCARIEFRDLTAQQIKQILQRIPSTFKASLDIVYEEAE